MTDFGYASDGTPVQWTVEFAGESDERGYWQDSWGNPYEVHEVTPARVVGPGEVVVKRDDLAYVLEFTSPGHFSGAEAGRLRAALAAAEPAPDSGQGETKRKPAEWCWLERVEILDADGWRGKDAQDFDEPITRDEFLDRLAECTQRKLPAASGGGSEAGGDERPIVHTHGLDPGCPERYDRAGYLRGRCVDPYLFDDTPAAEPQRVMLPDTPWTTVRVTLDDGDEQVWYTIDEAGVWYDDFQDVVYSGMRARVVDYTVLAEPPKADPAPRRTYEQWRRELRRTQQIEDRAAKRGRDEALAVVVKALRTFNTNSREYVEECEIGDIADQIEREAGGDGHA